MKRISFSLLLIIALLIVNCNTKKSKEQASSRSIDTIHVFVLKKGLINKKISLPAELIPLERAELYSRISGYVHEMNADIGDHVKINQVLAVIDAPEVIANYAKSYADLQAATARYSSSLDNYKRICKAADENGVISESEMEIVKNQMRSDSSALNAAKTGANAFAQLMNYMKIRAPFDGVIVQRQADPGALVSNSSKPLLVIENINKLRLRIAVPEIYSALLKTSEVDFTVNAIPNGTFRASFSRRSNHIDASTRTEIWEYEYSNSSGALKSGMFANAVINLQRTDSAFTIPFSALVTNLERNFVIRIRENKSEWVDVKNGMSLSDRIEIFGSLEEGDLLVLKANDEIKPDVSFIIKKDILKL
jgi:membrane fusion protein, multidrug efflux system